MGGVAIDVLDLLRACASVGISIESAGHDVIHVSPMSVLTDQLKAAFKTHKPVLLKLLTAPQADCLSDDPCQTCGFYERWKWFDERTLCRVCTALDLVPLTLVRSRGARSTAREEVA
jgi:hypothetical protein